jgi:SAM-dependent methyltransferase
MFLKRPPDPDLSQPVVRDVLNMAYPDFVAFLGQENTPPGSFRTIGEWVDIASIASNSRVLDLACSTGFSGREVHLLTQAAIHGIDISAAAISRARENARGNQSLSYEVADASSLPLPDQSFSHVLGGCNFGFIDARDQALDEVHRVLSPGGYLCVSAFYYKQRPPEELLDQVADAIGFRPDVERSRDYWSAFFSRRFSLVQEVLHDIPVSGARQVDRRVRRAVYGRAPALNDALPVVRDACYHRLRTIRLALDQHRSYQGLVVGAWQAR